jgi:hypothetical protein
MAEANLQKGLVNIPSCPKVDEGCRHLKDEGSWRCGKRTSTLFPRSRSANDAEGKGGNREDRGRPCRMGMVRPRMSVIPTVAALQLSEPTM